MRNDRADRAAGELHRLAQATALVRLYREAHGHEAASAEALARWAQRRPGLRPIKPTDADVREVILQHPDLVAVANGANP